MRIIIQHRRTQQFLRADQTWTADRHEAQVFGISAEAILFCREHGLRDVQLWFEFEGEDFTYCVPIE